jgi:hypothetical protein
MIDPAWLSNVRSRNQAAFGMAGMGDIDIVSAHRGERELRTQSIHRGRFEARDPYKPTEGSIESIAQAIGPANVPPPQQVPRGLDIAMKVAIVGLVGFIGVKLYQRSRG